MVAVGDKKGHPDQIAVTGDGIEHERIDAGIFPQRKKDVGLDPLGGCLLHHETHEKV